MSRAIQVRIRESITRVIHVEDGVAAALEMLPILPPERMADLLARELEGLGFVRDGNTCRRTEPDGIEVTVDLAAATIAVKLAAGAQVDESVELTASAAEERAEIARAALLDRARRQLDDQIATRTSALRKDVTAQLEAKIGDLQREIDGAIGRATVGALTEKAGQLGRIEETHQDAAGNLTIRVRL